MQEPLKMLVLANPRAGGGRVFRKLRHIEKWFHETGQQVEISIPDGRDETIRMAREAKSNGFDVVIAMGGDGTSKDTLAGATGTGIKFGLIPAGRGNDTARNLGYPQDLEMIVRGFKNPVIRKMDVPTVNGHIFTNSSGVGFDSAVVQLTTNGRCKMPGSLCYFYAVYRAVLTFKPISMRVTIDDKVYEGKYTMCLASNGEHFGGGMKIVPGAILDDGMMDICLLENISALKLMTVFPSVYKGKHVTLPEVTLLRGKKIVIESDKPAPVDFDGDLIGLTPAVIEVGKHTIEVLVPDYPRNE